ncbi:MAG: hypothetical protein V7K50_22955 [Nostoc sp.]
MTTHGIHLDVQQVQVRAIAQSNYLNFHSRILPELQPLRLKARRMY